MLGCNCTIVSDDSTREAIVVDGGDGVDEVLRRLELQGLRARFLVHTHAHLDHIWDLAGLRERTGAQGMLHPADLPLYRNMSWQASLVPMYGAPPRLADIDAELADGDEIQLGSATVTVLHTPGHTPGSVCFAVGEGSGTTVILSGDTLFAGSIGRWDLGGTSMEEIVASINAKLLDFPGPTAVIPGHGPFTTIEQERSANPYLQ